MSDNDNITIGACTEIIITGDVEFIADGSTELILEINNSPCLQGNTQRLTKPKQDTIFPNMFSLYPNPFVDEINIYVNIHKEQKINIVIFDLLGKQFFQSADIYQKGVSLIKINLPKLEPGTYIIKLFNSEINTISKIIKTF